MRSHQDAKPALYIPTPNGTIIAKKKKNGTIERFDEKKNIKMKINEQMSQTLETLRSVHILKESRIH